MGRLNLLGGQVYLLGGQMSTLLFTSLATVANADIGSLMSLYTLFDKYLNHRLVKLEQNHIVQTTRNFELFDKKSGFLNHFDQSLTPFWKMFL